MFYNFLHSIPAMKPFLFGIAPLYAVSPGCSSLSSNDVGVAGVSDSSTLNTDEATDDGGDCDDSMPSGSSGEDVSVTGGSGGTGDLPDDAPKHYSWVCNICKSVRFSNRFEAESHEETCSDFHEEFPSQSMTLLEYIQQVSDVLCSCQPEWFIYN